MAVMTTTQMVRSLSPGVRTFFGDAYRELPEEWTQVFETNSTERAYEEEVLRAGMNDAPIKDEGAPLVYDTTQELWTARYQVVTIAKGYQMTEEAVEDNLYVKLAATLTPELARAMRSTKERHGADVFNNAFTAGKPGGDGKSMCATDHPALHGPWANRPATASDFDETSLEDALIKVRKLRNDRGRPVGLVTRKLVIPPDLEFVARRVLGNSDRPGTSDRDVNAVVSMGKVPDGVAVITRLADPKAWFLLTDCPNGLKYFNRVAIATKMLGDFDSGNMRTRARGRWTFGWTDPRKVYGNPGGA